MMLINKMIDWTADGCAFRWMIIKVKLEHWLYILEIQEPAVIIHHIEMEVVLAMINEIF